MKIESIQISTADLFKELKNIEAKLTERDKATSSSESTFSKEIANIRWKTKSQCENAIKAMPKSLMEMIIKEHPYKRKRWITPILDSLFHKSLAGKVRFSTLTTKAKGRKNFIRMGVYCPILSVEVTEFFSRLIDKNKILSDPEKEFTCVKNYFNNRNRKMRKDEIKKLIDTAINQREGMKSRVACLLIANDLCENKGGITQQSPSFDSPRDVEAWLESFWVPVLTKLARKYLKVDPTTLPEQTNHDIIQICMEKRGVTLEDLRSGGGDDRESDDGSGDDSGDDNDSGGGSDEDAN